jgi:hypothetical protein
MKPSQKEIGIEPWGNFFFNIFSRFDVIEATIS